MFRSRIIKRNKKGLSLPLSVRTGLKAGTCLEECNDKLASCMQSPEYHHDPFGQSVFCQSDYDGCVDKCMSG